jgi:PAS domain-containing protein
MLPSTLHQTSQPVWIVDMKSLRYVDANAAALRFCGYSLDELQQRQVPDRHPDRSVKPLLDACVPVDHCRAKLAPYHAVCFRSGKRMA